jgi:hypothetical protein
MGIQDSIRKIILTVPHGRFFDSHFVISELISKHTDDYLRFTAEFRTAPSPTVTAHAGLSLQVKTFQGSLIERNGDAHSINIRGRANKCALWRRK